MQIVNAEVNFEFVFFSLSPPVYVTNPFSNSQRYLILYICNFTKNFFPFENDMCFGPNCMQTKMGFVKRRRKIGSKQHCPDWVAMALLRGTFGIAIFSFRWSKIWDPGLQLKKVLVDNKNWIICSAGLILFSELRLNNVDW